MCQIAKVFFFNPRNVCSAHQLSSYSPLHIHTDGHIQTWKLPSVISLFFHSPRAWERLDVYEPPEDDMKKSRLFIERHGNCKNITYIICAVVCRYSFSLLFLSRDDLSQPGTDLPSTSMMNCILNIPPLNVWDEIPPREKQGSSEMRLPADSQRSPWRAWYWRWLANLRLGMWTQPWHSRTKYGKPPCCDTTGSNTNAEHPKHSDDLDLLPPIAVTPSEQQRILRGCKNK